MMPLRIAGHDPGVSRAGVGPPGESRAQSSAWSIAPTELSGGEQQRTAVAAPWRSIRRSSSPTNRPATSTTPTRELLHDLLALARDLEIAMVVVTHNRSLARRADRALHMEDGVLREADLQGVIG